MLMLIVPLCTFFRTLSFCELTQPDKIHNRAIIHYNREAFHLLYKKHKRDNLSTYIESVKH